MNECGGDRACEFVCGSDACYSSLFMCSSTVSCKSICNGGNADADLRSIRVFRSQSSANVTGCPVVERSTCVESVPCVPGISCGLDDPCSGQPCYRGNTAVIAASGSGCECRCPPGTIYISSLCLPVEGNGNCSSPCLNDGLCFDSKCVCRPGFVGAHCESAAPNSSGIMVAYQANINVYCPMDCSSCQDGVCVIYLYRVGDRQYCPQDWPCLFVCADQFCGGEAVCEGTSGPCTVLCAGDRVPPLINFLLLFQKPTRTSIYRITPSGNCVASKMFCNTTATGLPCGMACVNDPLRHTNQIKTVTCVNSTGGIVPPRRSSLYGSDAVAAGAPNCWASDTCEIIQNDPCFISSSYSYRVVCPQTANLFLMEAVTVTNSTGQLNCVCKCPSGYKEQIFITETGLTDRNCIPTIDCSPSCALQRPSSLPRSLKNCVV